jgi:hypothetical protein
MSYSSMKQQLTSSFKVSKDMAVLIVARDCDPHPRVPVSRAPPYTFADADFPAMVAGDDATSQELNTYMVKRTWVAVVKDGALPVEATILGQSV